MAKTLTSANSVFTLAIDDLYPVAQKLEGYSTDDAFSMDASAVTETQVGVDGHVGHGFVFNPVKQNITLQANSPSTKIFDDWYNAMQAAREVYTCSAVIYIPSIRKKYTLTKGALSEYSPMPGAKKILEPLRYSITWSSANIVAEDY